MPEGLALPSLSTLLRLVLREVEALVRVGDEERRRALSLKPFSSLSEGCWRERRRKRFLKPSDGIAKDLRGVSAEGGIGSRLSRSTEAREEPRKRAWGMSVYTGNGPSYVPPMIPTPTYSAPGLTRVLISQSALTFHIPNKEIYFRRDQTQKHLLPVRHNELQ